MQINSYFIWTECLGCPEQIKNELKFFISSYSNFHLNVFIFEEDINSLPLHKNITYHKLPKNNLLIDIVNQFFNLFRITFIPSERILRNYFKRELILKSIIWAYILKKHSNYSVLIYYDLRLNLNQAAFENLIKKTNNFDFILGKKDVMNKNNFRNKYKYSLKSNICFFLLKPSLVPSIKRLRQYSLTKFIEGRYKLRNRYKYRFFDKISKEINANGGQKYEFDINNYSNFFK
tara:strand:+ start:19 stop:717 length:699 start_codon:yes stop_codon:yes gene_type:complete